MNTYYEILCLQEDASEDEIKQSYRRLIRENHPDRNKDPDATEKTKKIIEAYQVLNDPAKRTKYDEELATYRAEKKRRDSEDIGYKPRKFNSKVRPSDDEILKEFMSIMKQYMDEEERKREKGRELVAAISEKNWPRAYELIKQTNYINESLSRFSASINRDLYEQYPGFRPIHFSIAYQNHEFFSKLIELGADVNAQSEQGFSSLHMAVMMNDLNKVKILIGKGAYPHYTTNRKGNTPLHLAIDRGFKDIAIYLVDHHSLTRTLFNKVSSNNRKNKNDESPLILASKKAIEKPELWDVVERLLCRPEIEFDFSTASKIYIESNFNLPKRISDIIAHKENVLRDLERVRQANQTCAVQ